jgi:hypothetical protein
LVRNLQVQIAVEIATTGCCPFEQALICPRLEKFERLATERLGNIKMTIYREIEFTAISAHDLRDVRHFGGKMSPYVVAWINPAEKVASREDNKAGIAPEWNAKLRLVADESLVFEHEEEVVIHVELHDYSTQGKIIGSLSFNLSQLPGKASHWRGPGEAIFMSLPVRRPSGREQGLLNFSVRIGDRTDQLVTAPTQQVETIEPVTAEDVEFEENCCGLPYFHHGVYAH